MDLVISVIITVADDPRARMRWEHSYGSDDTVLQNIARSVSPLIDMIVSDFRVWEFRQFGKRQHNREYECIHARVYV